jgi:hypothetical protein
MAATSQPSHHSCPKFGHVGKGFIWMGHMAREIIWMEQAPNSRPFRSLKFLLMVVFDIIGKTIFSKFKVWLLEKEGVVSSSTFM